MRTFNSILAIFNQPQCLGVYTNSNRSHKASAGHQGSLFKVLAIDSKDGPASFKVETTESYDASLIPDFAYLGKAAVISLHIAGGITRMVTAELVRFG